MKKYLIMNNNGIMTCIYGEDIIKDWSLHYVQGKGTCLFVNNAFVATAKEVTFVGLTDNEYNSLVNGTAVETSCVVWSKKTKDVSGNTIITAKRANGEIVETVLDSNYHIVRARTIKP